MRLFFKALWCRDYTKSIPFTLGAARIGVRGWRWRQPIKQKLIFPLNLACVDTEFALSQCLNALNRTEPLIVLL
jgi:hypothetical protein